MISSSVYTFISFNIYFKGQSISTVALRGYNHEQSRFDIPIFHCSRVELSFISRFLFHFCVTYDGDLKELTEFNLKMVNQ